MVEKILNPNHFYNNIDKELIIVDVWFGRDTDGTSCTFNGEDSEPEWDRYEWIASMDGACYTENTTDTTLAYGKGFFGVRKGTYKKLKLIAVKEALLNWK